MNSKFLHAGEDSLSDDEAPPSKADAGAKVPQRRNESDADLFGGAGSDSESTGSDEAKDDKHNDNGGDSGGDSDGGSSDMFGGGDDDSKSDTDTDEDDAKADDKPDNFKSKQANIAAALKGRNQKANKKRNESIASSMVSMHTRIRLEASGEGCSLR